MIDSDGIMFRSLDFFTDLPFEPEKKIDHLYKLLNFGEAADMSYELAEKVTMGVMRLKGNSDDLFLHWLHFMGYYIKVKHGGKWYLARSFVYESIVCYHPSIINGEGQIWEVGDFCWQTYYVKGKLGGIGFPLFYKLNIEHLFGPHMALIGTNQHFSHWNNGYSIRYCISNYCYGSFKSLYRWRTGSVGEVQGYDYDYRASRRTA